MRRTEGLGDPAFQNADPSTIALFQDNWTIYRKMVDYNVLFHREAYGHLHRVLVDEVARPFRFLDVACGDAGASTRALRGTQIVEYRGIDFSAPALALASRSLEDLPCNIILEQGDFREALAGRTGLAEIAWVGLSLHHLTRREKRRYMRELREFLTDGGRLLIYENASREGEDREAWMRRWDLQRPDWTAFSEAEWEATAAHVHAADFPESDSVWRRLGRDAGFSSVREIYAAPTDLFRLYCFET